MPHPERASEELLGNEDGSLIFQSMIDALKKDKDRIKVLGV